MKAKSALNPDYDSVPLNQLLCEDHEVFGIELDEVSEYNRNRGGKGEEKSIKKERAEKETSLVTMVVRSDGGFEMKVKLIGGEVIVSTGNIKA